MLYFKTNFLFLAESGLYSFVQEGSKYQDHLIATLIETLHYFNLHKHELENILEIMIPKHVNLAFYPLALNL